MELLSPLRLLRDGLPIGPDRSSFDSVIGRLARRIQALCGGTDPALPRVARDVARTVPWQADLEWVPGERWSLRQRRTLSLSGLIGHMDLDLRGAEAIGPLLWHGQ